MITREEIDARAAKGAAWMDENAKGWHKLVDPENLDMASSCDCVWGQAFERFHYGKVKMKVDPIEYGLTFDLFDVEETDQDGKPRYKFEAVFPMLTEAWKAEIVKRREGR